jgi:DNA polymerase-3 subunit gamma/tau
LDVLEIDGASNRGIDEIRELRDTVRYAPASSKFKIYIIDEVHMLTKEAFNALLKTLEEPPEHAKFMFATTEPEKVLPTILSRCQRFDLRRIPSALIVKHLIHIASLEGVEAEETALQAIARGADGGMRDAESTLDQLISFCGSKIVEADVLSMFGMASRDQVLQLVRAIIDGDSLTVLQTVEVLTSEGKELGRLLSDLLSFFRNLMLFQLSNENPDLVQVSEAEMGVLRELAGKLVPERLARLLEVLSDCDYRMKGASSKRIFFEVALIKAIEAVQSVPLNEVLRTLKSLRSDSPVEIPATSGAQTRPIPERPSAPAPSPVPSPKVVERKPEAPKVAPVLTPTVAPPPVSAAVRSRPPEPVSQPKVPERPASGNVDLNSLWPKVLSYVEAKSPFTHSYLKVAKPLELNGRSLTIGFPPQAKDNIALLEGGKNKAMLSDALSDSGLDGCQLRFVEAAELSEHFEEQKAAAAAAPPRESRTRPQGSAGAGGATGPVEPEAVDLAEFRNDPLIKEALEIFKGQIVETGKSS